MFNFLINIIHICHIGIINIKILVIIANNLNIDCNYASINTYYIITTAYKKYNMLYKCFFTKQTIAVLSNNSDDLNTFLSMTDLDLLSYGQNFMSFSVKPSV